MTETSSDRHDSPAPSPPPITVSPVYKATLLAVLAVTFVAFGVEVAMSLMVDKTTDEVKNVLETADTIVKMGAGAIFGLLTGKSSA